MIEKRFRLRRTTTPTTDRDQQLSEEPMIGRDVRADIELLMRRCDDLESHVVEALDAIRSIAKSTLENVTVQIPTGAATTQSHTDMPQASNEIDENGARIIALNQALSGQSKDKVEQELAALGYGGPVCELVDDVYTKVANGN